MPANSTVAELRKAAEITDQEIEAAVGAYLADPRTVPFRFASGHEIDVAGAFRALEPAKVVLVESDRTSEFKRTMVRTAILLAYPMKG